jgi:transcriptional regulator with XRE-family HTH domain
MAGSHGKGSRKTGLNRKDLGRYVTQVMNAKGLSARDVAGRSGGGITAGYVTGIMKGSADNPSVDKIKALTSGLDVDRYELFDVAWGPSGQQVNRPLGNERLQALDLLDLMKKVAVSPWLMKILEKAARLSPEELEAVLSSVNRFAAGGQKPQRRKKRR